MSNGDYMQLVAINKKGYAVNYRFTKSANRRKKFEA